MPDLSRILDAKSPLTLASLARGAQPLVMGDLARAAKGRAVFVAPDDAAMRAITDAARWFAPELQVIEFPAWDCLPYDRASPALSVSSRRLSALHQLQAGKADKQLVVTTVNRSRLKPMSTRSICIMLRTTSPLTTSRTSDNAT